MNFVQQYYEFKHKWFFKISSLLLDFYINKEQNTQIEKIKYDYLKDLIEFYINKEKVNEKVIEKELNKIDIKSLNKIEFELLKYVIFVSKQYQKVKFTTNDYIYFTMILEITTSLYNSSFTIINENIAYKILKENLFRFEFIDFKRKQSKINILLKYLRFINKNESYYFSNLKNSRIDINVTALSYHNNYFIIDIKNKLPLLKFDEELVSSVKVNNDYNNKMFILNFNILIEQIVYLLEKESFKIDKIIFNLDKYKFDRAAINYINNYNSVISNYIMFTSRDKKKLDIISAQYHKCIYIDSDRLEKAATYKESNVLVKTSFWGKNNRNSKRFEGINFITINDNIAYKFNKEEK